MVIYYHFLQVLVMEGKLGFKLFEVKDLLEQYKIAVNSQSIRNL